MRNTSAFIQERGLAMVVVALALVGSACGTAKERIEVEPSSGSSDTSPIEQSTSTEAGSNPAISQTAGGSFLEQPANPLPVAFESEASASVSSEINEAGGTLTTTDSAGVTYTLAIPAGALTSPEMITMTPVLLTESPFPGARAHAVSLEPDGLILLESADLTIEGADLAPATSLLFTSNHDGSDLAPKPGVIDGAAVVPVAHFSLSGSVVARETEIAKIRATYRPSSREGRYTQEYETIFNRVEDPAAAEAALAQIMVEWFSSIEHDAGQIADEAAMYDLLGEFMSAHGILGSLFKHYGLGTESPLILAEIAMQGAAAALQDAAFRLFDQENLRCIQDQDPEAMFSMLRWALLYDWLAQNITGDGSSLEYMNTALRACTQFRVDFESAISAEWAAQMNAEVPLQVPEGKAAIFLLKGIFEIPAVEGTLTGAGSLGSLTCGSVSPIDVAMLLTYNANFGNLANTTVNRVGVSIRFTEDPNWFCDEHALKQAPWLPWFAEGFAAYRTEAGFYLFKLEKTSGGEIYAELTDARKVKASEVTIPVTLDVELHHTPQIP